MSRVMTVLSKFSAETVTRLLPSSIQAGMGDMKALAAVHGPRAMHSAKDLLKTEIPKYAYAVKTWGCQNPVSATFTTVGVSVVAAPALVLSPILLVMGWGASGVGASTCAAAIQSAIGSVPAGSAFAILQSAGAGGSGFAVASGWIQGAGAVVTAGSAAVGWVKSKL